MYLLLFYTLTRLWEKLQWEWKSISWKACFFTTPTCMVAVGTVHTLVFVLLVIIGECFCSSQGLFSMHVMLSALLCITETLVHTRDITYHYCRKNNKIQTDENCVFWIWILVIISDLFEMRTCPMIVQYFFTGFAWVQIEPEFVHIIMNFCRLAGKDIESSFFFFERFLLLCKWKSKLWVEMYWYRILHPS